MSIPFNNYVRSLPQGDRLSDSESEIFQLLTDGWVPFRPDGTRYTVSQRPDGSWLLDGKPVHDVLAETASAFDAIPWWGWVVAFYLGKKILFG